ncbi:MAG: hypothetical protein JWQ07_3287, partial [Ramlibacter sp.]|nr:hypothetical protein [Ramlibacter sp.]
MPDTPISETPTTDAAAPDAPSKAPRTPKAPRPAFQVL